MIENGWVLFDRKIMKWRWYKDVNTFKLFFHLVASANYKKFDFENITVKRGQRIASIKGLAKETGLSEMNVRTALKHLEETEEITIKTTPKYTVITVTNYDDFQSNRKLTNDQHGSNGADTPSAASESPELTNDQQAPNKRLTNDQQTTNNNVNKYNKDKRKIKEKKEGGAPVFEETGGTPPKESAEPILDKWGGRLDF